MRMVVAVIVAMRPIHRRPTSDMWRLMTTQKRHLMVAHLSKRLLKSHLTRIRMTSRNHCLMVMVVSSFGLTAHCSSGSVMAFPTMSVAMMSMTMMMMTTTSVSALHMLLKLLVFHVGGRLDLAGIEPDG